jgi:hypothetical protein
MRPFFSLCLAMLGLAIVLVISVADPTLKAAPPKVTAPPKKVAKHAPVGKRAVPKPRYQPKPKLKQVAHKSPALKIHIKIADKTEATKTTANTETPKTTAKTETPKTTAKTETPKTEDRTEKTPPKAKYERIASREHEWSTHSRHEHLWAREHWHTHRFAEFQFREGYPVYGFQPGWWHAFVVNPGSVNWTVVSHNNGSIQGVPQLPAGVATATGQTGPQIVKMTEALPISQGGQQLAGILDDMQVETHWLPNQKVDWKTGNPANPAGGGPASNGGAFVAAVCDRRNAPIPSSGPTDFEPDNQFNWLLKEGKSKSWVKVGEVEAQLLANQGWVVIAAWKNLNDNEMSSNSGQMTIVRPDREPMSELAKRGPKIILAGIQNANSTTVKDAFPPGAWRGQEIVYLAHQSQ